MRAVKVCRSLSGIPSAAVRALHGNGDAGIYGINTTNTLGIQAGNVVSAVFGVDSLTLGDNNPADNFVLGPQGSSVSNRQGMPLIITGGAGAGCVGCNNDSNGARHPAGQLEARYAASAAYNRLARVGRFARAVRQASVRLGGAGETGATDRLRQSG